MWRRLTVRVRITVTVASIFAVALAGGGAFLVDRHQRGLTAGLETTARLRAADLVAALEGGSLPSTLAVPLEDQSFAQIVDASGVVRRASPNIEGERRIATFTPGPDGTARTLEHLPVGDSAFRVVARVAHSNGADYVVYVGTSLEPVADAARNLTAALLLGAPALLGLITALTWSSVGRALQPVEQIRTEVATISQHDLHRRVPTPPHRDEIGRLAATMNAMLDRLEDGANRQRRFVADAAHELRSPLAGIRSQVEVDLAHPHLADWQATEAGILDETLHLQRLVDDLLALADADEAQPSRPHDLLDLDDLLLSEVRRLRIRGRRHVDATRVTAVQVVADRESLRRAIRNVLDNAERHANDTVTVSLTENDTIAHITVSDDGPGIPPGDLERIFERFARADPGRDRARGGAGLGLAIARAILTVNHGTIVAEPSDRGATFAIDLPVAQTSTTGGG